MLNDRIKIIQDEREESNVETREEFAERKEREKKNPQERQKPTDPIALKIDAKKIERTAAYNKLG